MSDELKLCPFCGGEAEVHEIGVTIECVHTDGTRDAYEMVAVGCVNDECPVMPCTKASGSVAEAVEKWNARAAATDEQFAVAVHDGRAWQRVRECRNVLDDHPCDFECSECGFSVSTVPEGPADWQTAFWSHCPNCGAKVTR